MSTITEIESAIEELSPEQVRELAEWLDARKAKLIEKKSSRKESNTALIGMWKGKLVLKEGWDELLEDFKPYME